VRSSVVLKIQQRVGVLGGWSYAIGGSGSRDSQSPASSELGLGAARRNRQIARLWIQFGCKKSLR